MSKVIEFVGAVVSLILAAAALIGYWLNNPQLYYWLVVGMAPNTAIALIALSVAVLARALKGER